MTGPRSRQYCSFCGKAEPEDAHDTETGEVTDPPPRQEPGGDAAARAPEDGPGSGATS